MPTLPQGILGSIDRRPSVWANYFCQAVAAEVGTSHGQLMVFPMAPADGVFPCVMTAQSMFIGMLGSGATADSGAHTLSVSLGVYTLANSTQLSLLNSVGSTIGTGVAATANRTLYNGQRQIRLESSQWSAVPAFSRTQYWLGLQFLSSGSAMQLSISGFEWMNSEFSGHYGVGNTDSAASRPFPGLGVFSVSFSSNLPSAIAFSDLVQADPLAGQIPSIIIRNIGA